MNSFNFIKKKKYLIPTVSPRSEWSGNASTPFPGWHEASAEEGMPVLEMMGGEVGTSLLPAHQHWWPPG